jgi:hypothetical protein
MNDLPGLELRKFNLKPLFAGLTLALVTLYDANPALAKEEPPTRGDCNPKDERCKPKKLPANQNHLTETGTIEYNFVIPGQNN